MTAALTVMVGRRSLRQIFGGSVSYRKFAIAAKGTELPLLVRNCKSRSSLDGAPLGFGAGNDVDEIDIVASPGSRVVPPTMPFSDEAISFRGDAKLARLVLQHVDLDDTGRLVPVVDDIAKRAGCGP
jgi:hypothetical protein